VNRNGKARAAQRALRTELACARALLDELEAVLDAENDVAEHEKARKKEQPDTGSAPGCKGKTRIGAQVSAGGFFSRRELSRVVASS
jgi:hypothetical protein